MPRAFVMYSSFVSISTDYSRSLNPTYRSVRSHRANPPGALKLSKVQNSISGFEMELMFEERAQIESCIATPVC